jgi:hypothetical protein
LQNALDVLSACPNQTKSTLDNDLVSQYRVVARLYHFTSLVPTPCLRLLVSMNVVLCVTMIAIAYALVGFRNERVFTAVHTCFCSTWRSAPLRSTGERWRDSSAIHAFYDDGKYLITTAYFSSVIAVASKELGRVHPVISLCMVPHDTAH